MPALRNSLLIAACALATAWYSPLDAQETPAPEVPLIASISELPEGVTSLAFSPDGKTLAVGSYETVQLYDAASRELKRSLAVKPGDVRALAFSPDGQVLACGCYQSAQLWSAADGKQLNQLKGHRAYVTGTAFSPDGKSLATSSEDTTVLVWDLSGPQITHTLRGHTYPVQGVAWSPDGKLLATAAGDDTRITKPGEVKLWDAVAGQEQTTLPEPEKAATSVAFSPDGKFLVSTSFDEKVNVYEVESGKALGFFGGHSRPTTCVAFSRDGKSVISGSGGRFTGNNQVKIWERETGEELATIDGHEAKVTSLALSPDGKVLATGAQDKLVALWDVSALLGAGDAVAASAPAEESGPKELRVGIIGLDTSHAVAFTKILNDPNAAPEVARCRVVAAYPKGSPDIESSVSRVPGYIEEVQKLDVEIVDSIEALLEKVDVVLLETNDGRPHLEQVLPVLKAGKPVFIDKPVAASLADAVAIYETAKELGVPVFSSSSLRFAKGAQSLRNGEFGAIFGCDAYSPASLEKTHPDLFWYGIHGVETLFTVMGAGCESVTRTTSEGTDVVTGRWKDGRIGTFRGIRKGPSGYGGTAFTEKGVQQIGPYGGYQPLIVEIVKFFRTGEPPVGAEETLEIYAFMEAADESKRQDGCPVTLASVLEKARGEAADR